jgi:hypothetical protein
MFRQIANVLLALSILSSPVFAQTGWVEGQSEAALCQQPQSSIANHINVPLQSNFYRGARTAARTGACGWW